ncbi:MAG: SUMF1/EgtB/PvdO family nonheme iron enzyme [Planctomycetota bacterium]|nr:SUMF1/EgtB/PvdO family nonheme iron enzyme [Planctomycetota bacterium]
MTSLRVGSASVRTVFLMFALLICSFVRTASAGDRYAFLVGVKQYDKTQLNSLAYTEADVTALADALRKAGYADKNIVLMTQAGGATNFRHLPSSQQIRKELNLLLGELNTDDTLLLAFSGHGVQFKDETNAYFCPMDANLKDRKTLISLTDVYDMLADPKKCKAQTKVLLVDACRNDPQSNLSKAGREIELDPAGVSEQPEPPGGVAAFFSCSRGQKSYEHPDLGHGIFANFIIEAFGGKGDLDKDGEISLAELEQYSVKQTQSYVRVELGERQTPERRGTVRGLIPLGTFDTLQDMITNSIGMKLTLIPAGEFLMGSSDADVAAALKADSSLKEEYLKDEQPQHRVKISRPFYAGVYEVTQGEYEAVMGVNPSSFSSSGGGSDKVGGQNTKRFPVETVTWYDAVEFCNKLSDRDNLPPYYSLTSVEREDGWIKSATVTPASGGRQSPDSSGYRLPTEAEWEYMCRSGTTSAYNFGNVLNGDKANVNGNYPFGTTTKGSYLERPTTVGIYGANKFGLHDVHGNVFEWCFDVYDESAYGSRAGTSVDPLSSGGSEYRVLRGGSWGDYSGGARSALRNWYPPVYRFNVNGFRVVR